MKPTTIGGGARMPGAVIQQQRADRVQIDGVDLVSFAGCNYLGLAFDPRVLSAVCAATELHGLSTSASRETSGNTAIHQTLEERVTRFVAGGADVCGVLVPDGYTANLAAAQGLSADCGTAVVDRRAHASLTDAARCAGMDVRFYAHADTGDLARVLADTDGRAVVMTDGVFTTDGTVAPILSILTSLRAGDRLLIDDCHGFGVLGGGRGVCAHLGIDLATERERLVYTSTLAKGLGGGGGIVIGGRPFIERVRSTAHAYVCTTPVSPLVATGTLAGLDVVEAEPERVERLAFNGRALRRAMNASDEAVPICAWPVQDHVEGERIACELRETGLFVPLMRYPGGPTPWYLRASVTSEHSADEIDRLAVFFRGRL